MDDEVDLSGVRLVAGLEGAGVEALVAEPHLGDEDGELFGRVNEQPHPRVTGPAVIARVQDVGAVQPGHTGHMLVNEAALGGQGWRVLLSPTPEGPPGSAIVGAQRWGEEGSLHHQFPLKPCVGEVTGPTLQVGKLSLEFEPKCAKEG